MVNNFLQFQKHRIKEYQLEVCSGSNDKANEQIKPPNIVITKERLRSVRLI